jgi:hypothetical protein
VSRPDGASASAAKKKQPYRFPWILLLLLLATLYLFWIYPFQRGRPPVQVTFEPANSTPK